MKDIYPLQQREYQCPYCGTEYGNNLRNVAPWREYNAHIRSHELAGHVLENHVTIYQYLGGPEWTFSHSKDGHSGILFGGHDAREEAIRAACRKLTEHDTRILNGSTEVWS